jgi:hypothetical protein
VGGGEWLLQGEGFQGLILYWDILFFFGNFTNRITVLF